MKYHVTIPELKIIVAGPFESYNEAEACQARLSEWAGYADRMQIMRECPPENQYGAPLIHTIVDGDFKDV